MFFSLFSLSELTVSCSKWLSTARMRVESLLRRNRKWEIHWEKHLGADPQRNYAGVSLDTPRNFKFCASYLCFVSTKQDTTASGIDPTGVRLSTPSDLRCIFSAAARWRFHRNLHRVCKLAIYGDPRTYVRPAHFFTWFLFGFFRRIVKGAVMRHTQC